MNEEKTMKDTFIENVSKLTTPEGVQQYLLGTKKNGNPRALYDVIKDYTKPKKKKGKKKKKNKSSVGDSTYAFYLNAKKGKKKGKKKKKEDKYWHI